ncbi:dna topoisomerase 2 [Quercus suber]|uniref:DNA topoisomerase (ATP-hydrolyzing) n=1 Tax=Quercus suber TaxID=58331 RepID=A0AAW0LJL6_QUESU
MSSPLFIFHHVISKSGIVDSLLSWATFKQSKDLKKSDGTKTEKIRDYYSVFPLRGKLLNVREATAKQLTENKEIGYIKQILGLQQHKEYTNVKSLRYGHLMIMTDQATHKNGTQLLFYTMPEYESWKHNLGGSASGWSIKYYKGLGTSTSKEGREYFANLEKHRKDFIWEDEQDGEAIELAFSKKKIEERKN